MIDDAHGHEPVPGMVPSWRGFLPMVKVAAVLWTVLIATCVLLTGCTDALGPSAPDPLAPQFMKTYQSHGDGGGGGGGGYGRPPDCTRPSASIECALKAAGLTIGGGAIAACASAGICLGLIPAWGLGAQDYINTPDCRSCGSENTGVGTGRSIGPTSPWNLPPGSEPDGY